MRQRMDISSCSHYKNSRVFVEALSRGEVSMYSEVYKLGVIEY